MKAIQPTVSYLSQLYSNYPDGGESGWFAFVTSEKYFYEWLSDRWSKVAITEPLIITSWSQDFEDGEYLITDNSTDTPPELTGSNLKIIVFTNYVDNQVKVVQDEDKIYYLVSGEVSLQWEKEEVEEQEVETEPCQTPIEKIPVFRYQLDPVQVVSDLYRVYPNGGELGFFSFVRTNKTFAYWDVDLEIWSLLSGGSGGGLQNVIAGQNIEIDYTDPLNPIIIGLNGAFVEDILVSLPDNGNVPGSLGRYKSGDTIPAKGKTAEEVFNLCAVAAIPPTITLTTPNGAIPFNTTTSHNKVLNFTKVIESLGGVVQTATLQWKRANESTWLTLSTDTAINTYTHTVADTALNTQAFNYRYFVTDDKGGTATALLDISIAAYQAPTENIDVTATKELGDISTHLVGLVTENSANCPITSWSIQASVNTTSWIEVNAPVSNTINYIHNNVAFLNATKIYYRLIVVDAKQTTNLALGAITLVHKSTLGYATSDPDIAAIEAFGNAAFTNSKSRTISNVTAGVGNYTYYCYAVSAGDLSNVILDGSSPILGAFTKLSDISGTNSLGANVNYRIYKSNATNAFTANTLTFS